MWDEARWIYLRKMGIGVSIAARATAGNWRCLWRSNVDTKQREMEIGLCCLLVKDFAFGILYVVPLI